LINIFDVFRTEPRFLELRTEPNSEPNRPTFVKNVLNRPKLKKSIPHTPTRTTEALTAERTSGSKVAQAMYF
jgi:hypothetical protein